MTDGREIIKSIIEVCNESIKTDVLSKPRKCKCGKIICQGVDLWQPIGRSDTFMIRNTLQSMLDYKMIGK